MKDVRGLLGVAAIVAMGGGWVFNVASTANSAEAKAEQNRVAIEEIRKDSAQIKTDVAVIRTKIEHLAEAQQKGSARIEAALGRLLERDR